MTWSLYGIDKNSGGEEKHRFLEPLKFSNGKNQDDIVKEVLKAVEDGHKIIFIHGVCGTGKCLDKSSLIFCKPSNKKYFGYYKISELEGMGGKILSVDKSGNLVESPFKNVRKTGRKKLFKLKTRTGKDVIASGNHPFLTITENGLSWESLEKLNEKSYICLPNKINLEEHVELGDDEIKILAHLIAEGKLKGTGSPAYFQDQDQNPMIRDDYETALKNLFPKGIIKSYSGDDVNIIFNKRNTAFGTTNKLRLLIKYYGLDGKRSNEKFVPRIIFNLRKEKIALFLNRLFSCEGCIYQKGKGGQRVIEYCSISKRLIQDVSILLQRFGIQHTITSKKFRDNENCSWRISISNQEYLKKYIQEIGFIGRKQILALELFKKMNKHKFTNIDKVPRIIREYLKNLGYNYTELNRFLNYEEIEKLRKSKGLKKIRADKNVKTPFVFNQLKIDFLRSHIAKINNYVKDKTLSFICNEQIFWDKVKSINYLKEDETYDLEVLENHNFIANGIIVHNSGIALNIARKLGKASVVVPIKNLQQQYKKDYEKDKYLLKDSGEKLKIHVITGRRNHKCKFLEDKNLVLPKIKTEVNAKLHDIFSGVAEQLKEKKKQDLSADRYDLPCKIEIKEKNIEKIKKYLKQNKKVNYKNFQTIQDVKRISVAGACPYWCPVLPDKYELKIFENAKQRTFQGLCNTNYIFYQRKPGCGFYEQFNSYIDADVIVFNSLKYKLESALNRKPLTEVEIIDECDEFLDSFANQRNLNLDRLQASLVRSFSFDERVEKLIKDMQEIITHIKRNPRIEKSIEEQEIIPLKETGIYDLIRIFLDNPELLEDIDDESYMFEAEETARMFEDFLNDTYLTFHKKDKSLIASLVTTNLEKKFKEMVDKNKIVVLMSGTLHSEAVLKGVFGLEDYQVIEAEIQQQGQIEVQRTGLEIDCKYANFSRGKFTREDYLRAFDKCVEVATKPVLVHVQSFVDLPLESEIETLKLKNLISKEKLQEIQSVDRTGKLIEEFKSGKNKILFSTRCSRGIDFPGEQCNSIVFTKYPNPNVKDSFWKVLHKTKPQYYWDFYKDKARRELLQKIYRGVRFDKDHVYLLSPDTRVLSVFEESKSF